MSNIVFIPTNDTSNFEGEYDGETNKVFLSVDCYCFSGPLGIEDINEIIKSLKELQNKII